MDWSWKKNTVLTSFTATHEKQSENKSGVKPFQTHFRFHKWNDLTDRKWWRAKTKVKDVMDNDVWSQQEAQQVEEAQFDQDQWTMVDTRLGLNTDTETDRQQVWRQYGGDLWRLWSGMRGQGRCGQERHGAAEERLKIKDLFEPTKTVWRSFYFFHVKFKQNLGPIFISSKNLKAVLPFSVALYFFPLHLSDKIAALQMSIRYLEAVFWDMLQIKILLQEEHCVERINSASETKQHIFKSPITKIVTRRIFQPVICLPLVSNNIQIQKKKNESKPSNVKITNCCKRNVQKHVSEDAANAPTELSSAYVRDSGF